MTPPRRVRSLQDLATLKKTLAKDAAEAARREAEARANAAREQRERHLFEHTVGPVLPLRRVAAMPLARPRVEPLPRQRERDEAAVLREAISDEFDVESLLETDDALSWRGEGIGPEVVRKLRRGVWAIQAQLDLHGLRRDEAREQLASFVREAVRHGLRCVRVIHGKGNGSPGREPVLSARPRTKAPRASHSTAEGRAYIVARKPGAVMQANWAPLQVTVSATHRPRGNS